MQTNCPKNHNIVISDPVSNHHHNMMSSLRAKKTTKGKQKIEIKKIEDEDARYISFSKRRNGVFAKASDLSTLCGTDLVVLIFSPTGRPHSFGSPAVDPVIDRFLSGDAVPPPGSHAEQAYRRQVVQNLSQQVMGIAGELETGRAKRAVLDERHAAACQGMEWVDNLDCLGLQEIDRVKELFEQLKARADARVREHLAGTGSNFFSDAAVATNPAGASWSAGIMAVNPAGGGGILPSSNLGGLMAAQPLLTAPVIAINPIRMTNPYEPAPLQPNNPPADALEFSDITGLFDGF